MKNMRGYDTKERVALLAVLFVLFLMFVENQGDLLHMNERKVKTEVLEMGCQLRRGNATQAPYDSPLIFPWPKVVQHGEGVPVTLSLSDNLLIRTVGLDPTSRGALQRFCDLAKSHRPGTTLLTISVDEVLKDVTQISNNSYQLDVTGNANQILLAARVSSLAAVNPFISTLTQIMGRRPTKALLPLKIRDFPQYAWRGLLVDVARHYIPLKLLRRTLDAMELSKFNILHLHLTDSQSFPVLLRDTSKFSLSQLAIKGSHKYPDMVYSLKDLSDLVQYAADRGVSVVPEIDVPAHSL